MTHRRITVVNSHYGFDTPTLYFQIANTIGTFQPSSHDRSKVIAPIGVNVFRSKKSVEVSYFFDSSKYSTEKWLKSIGRHMGDVTDELVEAGYKEEQYEYDPGVSYILEKSFDDGSFGQVLSEIRRYVGEAIERELQTSNRMGFVYHLSMTLFFRDMIDNGYEIRWSGDDGEILNVLIQYSPEDWAEYPVYRFHPDYLASVHRSLMRLGTNESELMAVSICRSLLMPDESIASAYPGLRGALRSG